MTARRTSHQDKVKNAYAALQAMQEEEEAKAAAASGASDQAKEAAKEAAEEPLSEPASSVADAEPPHEEAAEEIEEEATEEAEEAPAEPSTPEEAQAAPEAPKRPRTARAKAPKKPSRPSPPAETETLSSNKIRFTVAMDPDLIELMGLARPAFGGLKIAQVFFAAARKHGAVAAELPDTPLTETVLDDRYDDVVTEAAHRTPYTGYVTRKGYAALDADATAAGLDHSEFVRRTVRRLIAVEHAFVPASKARLLDQPSRSCDEVMQELKVQMDHGRPAVVLPTAGSLVWKAVELPEGTPLRALTDEALLTMPGCTSATQALLTVL